MRFTLPSGSRTVPDEGDGKQLESVDLRPGIVKDQVTAAKRSKMFGTEQWVEMIRLAITHVNGEQVKAPYMELDVWSLGAFRAVQAHWVEVNGIASEDDADPLPDGSA